MAATTTTLTGAIVVSRGERVLRAITPFFLPVALIAAYGVYASVSGNMFFPTLEKIAIAFQQSWLFAQFWSDFVPSMVRMLSGFALGSLIGILIGMFAGISRNFSVAIDPVVQFMRSLPAPALIPLSLLIIGPGDLSKVAIITLGSMWPVLLNTIDGVRSVHPTQLDSARSLHIPWLARLVHILLPTAQPRIFTGMKTALALSLILMVVTEMFSGTTNGIGFRLVLAQNQFNLPRMWAAIVLLGLLGYFLNYLYNKIEFRALSWYYGMLGRSGSRR